jgi:uncharacterized protein
MSWLNLGLLLVLIAGHAEVWVALINRLHAKPLSPDLLQRMRHVHDLLIPGFALAVLGGVGLTGPRLLFGGAWGEVGWGWYPFLMAAAAGVIGGLNGIVRFHGTRRCSIQVGKKSQVSVVRLPDGTLPVARGPFERMARLPFNEQLSVDINRKQFSHPGLPQEFSGLRILHLSDWHFEGTITREYFEQVTQIAVREVVDLVVFTGDLLDQQACLEWLPTTLGRFSAPLGCWYILGNHDWYLGADETRDHLKASGWKDAITSIHSVSFRGGTIQIAGDETPWMGQSPVFPKRTETQPDSAPEFRILLSHTPDNIERARQQGVDLMLSGHNHGGQVVLPLIGPVYSPSRFGCRYAGGSFWQTPTLLHVSRGLSGRHPFRWRCRPEVTVLEFLTPGELTNSLPVETPTAVCPVGA